MNGFAELQAQLTGGFHGMPFGGQMSTEQIADLIKALNVGSDRDPPASATPGDGFAFRTEDLDPLMRITTFEAKHIVLWKMLQKTKASNTVVEWNEISSYGEDGFDGFIQDGQLPEMQDTTAFRRHAYIKFMGIQGGITHGSTLVNSADGNLMAGETERKTLRLLEMVERAMHYGDSTLDSIQFDGFFTQMIKAVADGRAPATQIKDMRGASLSAVEIEQAAGITHVEPNWGTLTDMFCNPLVKSDMSLGILPANRGQQGVGSTNGKIGGSFNTVTTSIGDINVVPNPFIHFGRTAASVGNGDAVRRPPTPTLVVAPTSPVEATAQFAASDAGDYTYSVVARNRYGSSVPLSIGSVTVAAGDKVTFGIQATPGPQTLSFEIYRSTRNGGASTEALIQRIPNPSAGFTTVTINDLNADLPGTSMAFAVEWRREVLDFKQLAPFMKVMLGQNDLQFRWVHCVYGTPILYTPRKFYLFKNIGRATPVT